MQALFRKKSCLFEEDALRLMLTACADRSRTLGKTVLSTLQLVYVPLELVYMALNHTHALHALGELAAILRQKFGASLVSALVLSLELDYP